MSDKKRSSNKIFALISISGFVLFCIGSANAQLGNVMEIIEVLKPIHSCPTNVTSRTYFSHEWLCYNKYTIFNDSTFDYYARCENNAYFMVGKWWMEGDSITLMTDKALQSEIFCDVSFPDTNNKKIGLSEIYFYDKKRKPIDGIKIYPSNEKLAFSFFGNDDLLGSANIENADQEYIYSDSTGKALINCLKYDSIELSGPSITSIGYGYFCLASSVSSSI